MPAPQPHAVRYGAGDRNSRNQQSISRDRSRSPNMVKAPTPSGRRTSYVAQHAKKFQRAADTPCVVPGRVVQCRDYSCMGETEKLIGAIWRRFEIPTRECFYKPATASQIDLYAFRCGNHLNDNEDYRTQNSQVNSPAPSSRSTGVALRSEKPGRRTSIGTPSSAGSTTPRAMSLHERLAIPKSVATPRSAVTSVNSTRSSIPSRMEVPAPSLQPSRPAVWVSKLDETCSIASVEVEEEPTDTTHSLDVVSPIAVYGYSSRLGDAIIRTNSRQSEHTVPQQMEERPQLPVETLFRPAEPALFELQSIPARTPSPTQPQPLHPIRCDPWVEPVPKEEETVPRRQRSSMTEGSAFSAVLTKARHSPTAEQYEPVAAEERPSLDVEGARRAEENERAIKHIEALQLELQRAKEQLMRRQQNIIINM